MGAGGEICRRHRAWAGSGGAESGAARAPGETVATAAAPRLAEDDEERRKRRGGTLLRSAGFRLRGRLCSLRAGLSKCGARPPSCRVRSRGVGGAGGGRRGLPGAAGSGRGRGRRPQGRPAWTQARRFPTAPGVPCGDRPWNRGRNGPRCSLERAQTGTGRPPRPAPTLPRPEEK